MPPNPSVELTHSGTAPWPFGSFVPFSCLTAKAPRLRGQLTSNVRPHTRTMLDLAGFLTSPPPLPWRVTRSLGRAGRGLHDPDAISRVPNGIACPHHCGRHCGRSLHRREAPRRRAKVRAVVTSFNHSINNYQARTDNEIGISFALDDETTLRLNEVLEVDLPTLLQTQSVRVARTGQVVRVRLWDIDIHDLRLPSGHGSSRTPSHERMNAA